MSDSIPITHKVDIRRFVYQPLLQINNGSGTCDLDPAGDIAIFLKTLFNEAFSITGISFSANHYSHKKHIRLPDHRGFHSPDTVHGIDMCQECKKPSHLCKLKGQMALVPVKSTNVHIILKLTADFVIGFEAKISADGDSKEETAARCSFTITGKDSIINKIIRDSRYKEVLSELKRHSAISDAVGPLYDPVGRIGRKLESGNRNRYAQRMRGKPGTLQRS